VSTAVQQPLAEQEQDSDLASDTLTSAIEHGGVGARVHALDFSAPTKFNTELRRRIGRVLTPFCKALSTRMATDLRAPVELHQANACQLSWTEARASLPEDSVLAAVEVAPIGAQMLLGLEMPLVLRSLDCLLGGSAAGAPQSRKLSEIDWALARRLVESIVLQLSMVWRDLGGLELSVGEIDLEGDAGLIVPIGEPTFAVTLELEIAGLPSTLVLLVPWVAIEPVAGEILRNGSLAHDADPRQASAMHRGLSAAKVLLRAEIGATMLPVEQVLALQQGSLLRLDARAQDGVSLLAENVPLASGTPGRSGVRRAIKLTRPIEPESEMGLRPALGAAVPAQAPTPADRQAMLEGLARLRGVDVRVWAELGRTRMSLSDALRLPQGSVIELDQGADDAIELFVNGLPFASGTLATTAEGDWAIQVAALS
jgi:flagellar motor switch protein FliM